MKENLTNAGKKEQRQINQVLDKAVKEGTLENDGQAKEAEARTVPKGHKTTGKKKTK